ncbi:hypothetical protein [Ensifer sp.]|uniref:hypothetical protein n=1 Tax=Ensifer sp. TaxID=1872086 RepID=UPI000DDB7ED8|nr:hypothetical protein [Ensifer sp.]
MTIKAICIAFAVVAATVSQASAGGLSLGVLSGKKVSVLSGGVANGIVIAPSVDVGDVLSGNDILNKSLNGTLNNVLSGNALGILSGNGGKQRRH